MWERIARWDDDRKKGIRTLIEDFNARTGELSGRGNGGMRGVKRGRRSRDRKVNKEGSVLVSGLEQVWWYIFNRCGKGDQEGDLCRGKRGVGAGLCDRG